MNPTSGKVRPKRSAALPARLSCAGESGAAAGLGLVRAQSAQERSSSSPTPPPKAYDLPSSPGCPVELARLHQAIRDKDPEMKALLARLKEASKPPVGVDGDDDGFGSDAISDTVGSEPDGDVRDAQPGGRNARENLSDAVNSASSGSMGGGARCDDGRGETSSETGYDVDEGSVATPGSSRSVDTRMSATSKPKGKAKRGAEARSGQEEGNGSGHAGKRKRKKPLPPKQPAPIGAYGKWKLMDLRRVVLFRGLSGHQKQKDRSVLSNLLTRLDAERGRTSPYTGDFVKTTPSQGEVPTPLSRLLFMHGTP